MQVQLFDHVMPGLPRLAIPFCILDGCIAIYLKGHSTRYVGSDLRKEKIYRRLYGSSQDLGTL